MAYQAQINIKTTGLSGLNKINASVDRINKAIIQINKGGSKIKAGKDVVKVSQQDLAVKKDILKIETQIANQLQRQKSLRGRGGAGGGGRSTGTGGTTTGGGGGSGILSGALISGAFPVLFGGGIAGGAAGFGGGLIGGALGGQTGGFAGGLVATAALQATTALGELGQALNPLTADITKLTSAVGLIGTQEQLRLQIIERLEGKQAALAAATQNMAAVIGDSGVESLKTFGKNFTAVSNNFARFSLKLQSNFAALFNRIIELFPALKGDGGSSPVVNEKVQERLETEPEGKEINAEIDRLTAELTRLETAFTKQQNAFIPKELTDFFKGGSVLFPSQIDNKAIEDSVIDQQKITDKKKELEDAIKEKNALKDKLTIEEQINEAKRTAALATKDALNDSSKEITLLQAKLDGNYQETLIKQRVAEIMDAMEASGVNMEHVNAKDIENQLNREESLKRQVDEAERLKDAFNKISTSIKNDIKNGIAGLIKGTSTLGDMLNNIADKLLNIGLDYILFGSALGAGGPKGGGLFGLLGFANGGMPPVGKPSIVGEKGPELFVPKTSGTVIPNDKLGGGGSTNISVNVDASGSSVQGDNESGKELGRLISVAIQSELLKQRRPGGLLR